MADADKAKSSGDRPPSPDGAIVTCFPQAAADKLERFAQKLVVNLLLAN